LVPSKSEFQKKFNSIAKKYDNISNPYIVKRRSDALKIESAELILEAGSGTGFVTKSFKCKVVCTDFSFEMCKEAKKRHNLVVCCDAEFLPFKTKTFDAVISAEMIYYLEKPQNFIAYCNKILKKNGILFFALPNQDMITFDRIRTVLRKIGFNKMYFDDGIRNFMKIDQLKSLLEENKFKITAINKQVLFPFHSLDNLNRTLEKTIFKHFCLFFIVKAKAQNN